MAGAIASVAGADPAAAIRLGTGMTLVQFGIGATNDIADAGTDTLKPGKPIPAGRVSLRLARALAAAGFVGGIALSLASGPALAALAVIVAADGLLYDLWLKGTPWAWLPYAVGIPLLPVYGWLGATASVPGVFLVLVPTAALAGAALSLGNGLVDIDRDRASGVRTPAVALGASKTWGLAAGLYAAVAALAIGSLVVLGGRIAGLALVLAGVAIGALGVGLARGSIPARRERGWELQALGVALLAAGWLAGVAIPV